VCTLALYFHIFPDYPLVVAANRDEHYDRPSSAPEVLATTPRILAGKDLRAGGTWLGVNEYGLLAGILNRRPNGEPSPPSATRSRGLLCLDLLRLESASQGGALMEQEKRNYQPFTLVCADRTEAWAAINRNGSIHTLRLGDGIHVFSSAAAHDERSEKKERAYALFSALVPELTRTGSDVSSWPSILANVLSDHMPGDMRDDRREAICVHGDVSGTVSSSILIYSPRERRFQTFFCSGPPCQNSFDRFTSLNTDDRSAKT
jgi:uncharacterized protein with NRDE domain